MGSDDRQLCLSPTATSCLINTPVLLGPLPLSQRGSRWLVCRSHNCWSVSPSPSPSAYVASGPLGSSFRAQRGYSGTAGCSSLFLAGRGTVLSKLNLFVPGDTLNLPCLSFLTWAPSWDTSVLLSVLVWFPDHPCI